MPKTRKAIVSYALDDSSWRKHQLLLKGMRECACELRELDVDRREIAGELVERQGYCDG